MPVPLTLVPGIRTAVPPPEELNRREEVIRLTAHKYLPEFVKAVEEAVTNNVMNVATPQDVFAVNYEIDDLTLIGVAVKYAGIYGIGVQIFGTNGTMPSVVKDRGES